MKARVRFSYELEVALDLAASSSKMASWEAARAIANLELLRHIHSTGSAVDLVSAAEVIGIEGGRVRFYVEDVE